MRQTIKQTVLYGVSEKKAVVCHLLETRHRLIFESKHADILTKIGPYWSDTQIIVKTGKRHML